VIGVRRRGSRRRDAASLDFSFLLDASDWGWGAFVEDYALLGALVLNLKPQRILEIGTSTGLGAVVLARAAVFGDPTAHVTTIDVDQSRSRLNLELAPGVEEHITFVEGSTNDVLPDLAARGAAFDLVFVDGAHDYEQASSDWGNTQGLTETWVLHDTTQFTGLQRLVREIRESREYDVFQCVSATGHRKYPELTREGFITGMTLVQRLSRLATLAAHAHRDDHGELLPGHPEREVPGLSD
jgi:SAM-dependent methyltransferase